MIPKDQKNKTTDALAQPRFLTYSPGYLEG